MKIIFIGASIYIPEVGKETASFLIDEKILVDTGWCNVLKMREYGINPLAIRYLILTHLHQDHYLGLPQLLFYIGLHRLSGVYKPVRPLVIIGPAGHLQEIVAASRQLLQLKQYPELAVETLVVPLVPGEKYEGDDFLLETTAAKHFSGKGAIEEALACKITSRSTGKSVVFTGDTSFHPPLAEFARKAPLLIHDGSHSTPEEAAHIAEMADVEKLCLIHCCQDDKIINDVRRIFPRAFLARDGLAIDV